MIAETIRTLNGFGYGVRRRVRHPVTGKPVAFQTYPLRTAGSINYLPDAVSLWNYAARVAANRDNGE